MLEGLFMKKTIKTFLSMISAILILVMLVSAAGPGVLTYYKSGNNTFGQWVIKENGWDRYLMFFSCNSTVVNGKPSTSSPGDSGTYNTPASSWWADRIWLTWSFGDGKNINGWDANDGNGNIPPFLMLSPGGSGQSCLVGDPSVVYWQGQWHMYYEGTDNPDGSGNRIFHATASSWMGPWTKQGQVSGLWADTRSCGLSWPTVLVDGSQLVLYFTDNSCRLMAAYNTDTTGSNFTMANYDGGIPLNYDPNQGTVNPVPVRNNVNRGTVKYFNGTYNLVFDNFGRTTTYTATSSNKFNFLNVTATQIMSTSDGAWYNNNVGLPSFCFGSYTNRIYFTGNQSGLNKLGYYE